MTTTPSTNVLRAAQRKLDASIKQFEIRYRIQAKWECSSSRNSGRSWKKCCPKKTQVIHKQYSEWESGASSLVKFG